MIIPIRPVPAYPSSGTMLLVDGGKIELGVTASFLYTLMSASSGYLTPTERCSLTTEQYNSWLGDDSHCAYSVAHNVGLQPATGAFG